MAGDGDTSELDVQLISILEERVPHELPSEQFARKEVALRAIFDTLTPVQAYELHRRLVAARPTDPLSAPFDRLVAERRMRLLAYLSDPRRRAALAQRR